ncbi:GlxA family transcriptional regulator [Nonomuraea sp. NPDC050556]|uniref:GlxA family transcriptional regulator n=1 Tax=Nonomuraea sp. NPDC050556 TaxID=3364369 RepID=UPI0037B48FDC
MPMRVVAYAPPNVTALSLGIVNEIFNRPDRHFAICTDHPGALRTDLGMNLPIDHGLDTFKAADLILCLPGTTNPTEEAQNALKEAHHRGTLIAAHCIGVFLPAAAGLLDGLEATTHWRFADQLAQRHPEVRVKPESLYIDQGQIVTGAGAAAGIDLCLHLLRREYGSAAANAIARDLVTPPHREGGQRQFVTAPVPGDGDDARLTGVIAWARDNLAERISVEELAAIALMSPRSFARRFKAATGATPHAWLLAQRLNLAEELLETTELPVEEVARRVGYGSAAVLREQFVLRRGVPPRDYRRAFHRNGEAPAPS